MQLSQSQNKGQYGFISWHFSLLTGNFSSSAGDQQFSLPVKSSATLNKMNSCSQICSFVTKMGPVCPDCLHLEKVIQLLLHFKRRTMAYQQQCLLIECGCFSRQWLYLRTSQPPNCLNCSIKVQASNCVACGL